MLSIISFSEQPRVFLFTSWYTYPHFLNPHHKHRVFQFRTLPPHPIVSVLSAIEIAGRKYKKDALSPVLHSETPFVRYPYCGSKSISESFHQNSHQWYLPVHAASIVNPFLLPVFAGGHLHLSLLEDSSSENITPDALPETQVSLIMCFSVSSVPVFPRSCHIHFHISPGSLQSFPAHGFSTYIFLRISLESSSVSFAGKFLPFEVLQAVPCLK